MAPARAADAVVTTVAVGPAALAVAPAFATGPAVVVPADYRHPDDHVDSTGAYLPTNGKPTLVFVDAIW